MKNLLGIILILGSLGAMYAIGTNIWADIGGVRVELDDLEQKVAHIERAKMKLDQMQTSFNTISPGDREKLDKMIPTGSSREDMLLMLNGMVSRGNVELESLALKPSGKTGDEGNLSTLDVTIGVKGTYGALINFLNEIEYMVRLTDMQTVAFTAGESDEYSFNINAKSYYVGE
ncbi:MAG: type 4a pilus biogenesis protein PilO [Patescibacteria group bacterium]